MREEHGRIAAEGYVIGQTLGHYRIESKLGQGGMGVVYAARDLHLGRRAAIKVLPPAAVADPDRRRRFVQEAQAASTLNHPNILHIYDVEATGAEDGCPADFIAMEYVSGRTLDRLIAGRGLPVDQALQYAAQIAGGLAAAHAVGIVHRDLKPGNVMVNEQGLVKILDFGLAKLIEPLEADEIASTQAIQPGTQAGTILGTVPYMSPEQAEGKSVDARSDIFSFGAVLYEMITGRRAFPGDSTATTLAAILHQEPKPVSELVKSVPRELERIVGQCLRKDPARRFQHLDDVKVLLDQLRDDIDRGKDAVGGESAPPARRAIAPLALAAAVAVLLAVAGFVWWKTRPAPPNRGPGLTRLTSDSGLTTDPALSSDGRLLAYASDRAVTAGAEDNLDLWVQQLPAGEPLRLTRHTADDREPSFSPDGTRIAFRSERDGGGVYTMPALGGDERLIAPYGRRPVFSPDGESIVYWTGVPLESRVAVNGKIFVVPALGGQTREVQTGVDSAGLPVWSPHGKRILFVRWVVESGAAPPRAGVVADHSRRYHYTGCRQRVLRRASADGAQPRGLAGGRRPRRLHGQVRRQRQRLASPDFDENLEAHIRTRAAYLRLRPRDQAFDRGPAGRERAAGVCSPGREHQHLGASSRRRSGETQRRALQVDADRCLRQQSRAYSRRPAHVLQFQPRGEPGYLGEGPRQRQGNQPHQHPGGRVEANHQRRRLQSGLPDDGDAVGLRLRYARRRGLPGRASAGCSAEDIDTRAFRVPMVLVVGRQKASLQQPAREAVRLFDAGSGETTQVLGPLCFQVHFAPDDRWIVFTRQYPNELQPAFIAPAIA